jgi:sulfur carrier protein
MKLLINGREREVPKGITVEDLIAMLDIKTSRLAFERNREVVPRTRYAVTALEDGDKIEIVTLVGGG